MTTLTYPLRWTLCLTLLALPATHGWGFYAHKKINEQAVFLLPQAMAYFFKAHRDHVREHAVGPDKRRYVVAGEAQRHYIDLEYYQQEGRKVPYTWQEAVSMHGKEALARHGTLPWHILLTMRWLTEAFRAHDAAKVLRHAADLGHYMADACTPLHTTANYNGQMTCQEGIHGFWETRLPELFADGYNYFLGPATYLDNPLATVWEVIWRSHRNAAFLLERVAAVEASFPAARQYTFEQRGMAVVRMPGKAYATAYHASLEGQVERQMRLAVQMVAACWYTCWVDAGQPDLARLLYLED